MTCVLGQGSFRTVCKAEHSGTECAAKWIDFNVIETLHIVDQRQQNFMLECLPTQQ